MRRAGRLLTFAFAVTTALASCRAAPAPEDPPAGAPTELAGTPRDLPAGLPPAPIAGRGTQPPSAAPSRSPSANQGGRRAARFRVIGSTRDRSGDAGLEAPGYADLLGLVVEDDGHSARVTVDVAARLPDPMPRGEQLAIGVDLYRGSRTESDYQLYAQGTQDGWLAYLATPDGIVEYPGRFAIGGSRVVFVVPWDSLGSRTTTAFGGYLDWDRDRPVVNEVAHDRAPDEGRTRFTR